MKIVEDQCVQSWLKTSAILSPPHLCSLSLRVIRRCQERPLLKLFITHVSACSLSLTHTSTKLTRIPMTPTLCVQRAQTHTHTLKWAFHDMSDEDDRRWDQSIRIRWMKGTVSALSSEHVPSSKTPYSKTNRFVFSEGNNLAWRTGGNGSF